MAITRTAKGTASTKTSGTTLTISGVSFTPGTTAVLSIAWEEDVTNEKPVVTFGNKEFKYIANSEEARGDTIVRQYKKRIKNSKSKDLVATWPSNHTARAMCVSQITESSKKDVQQSQNGATTTSPGTGTAATSTVADTISIAAFAVIGPTTDTAATAGSGHTIGQRVGTSGGGAASNITLQETYEILSATGNVQSTLTLTASRAYAATIVAFSASETYEVKVGKTFHRPWNVYQGSNVVAFEIEDGANVVVDRVTIPTDVFEMMTDQQAEEYIASICQFHVDRAEGENLREDPDTDIETRLATFEGDTFPI